jgi:hypothetical protein
VTRLSPHFSVEEATASQTASRLGIDNTIPDDLMPHVFSAAVGLELVRKELNSHAIMVSSWYRCPELNKAVGSKPTSAHTTGYAIDFTCPTSGSPAHIVAALVRSKVPFDQLIQEFYEPGKTGGWVHISFDPKMRGQALIIDHNGTRSFV